MTSSDEERSSPIQRRVRTGNNTCGKSSLHTRLTKQLAGILAHLEQHPNDGLSKKRVATIQDLLRR